MHSKASKQHGGQNQKGSPGPRADPWEVIKPRTLSPFLPIFWHSAHVLMWGAVPSQTFSSHRELQAACSVLERASGRQDFVLKLPQDPWDPPRRRGGGEGGAEVSHSTLTTHRNFNFAPFGSTSGHHLASRLLTWIFRDSRPAVYSVCSKQLTTVCNLLVFFLKRAGIA